MIKFISFKATAKKNIKVVMSEQQCKLFDAVLSFI